MKKCIGSHIVIIGLCLLIFSCSGTKRLKEGETLYVGVKKLNLEKASYKGSKDWEIRDNGSKKVKAISSISILPNGAALGLPFYRFIPTKLLIYNWFYTEKEKGFSRWMMRNFGEPPVLMDDVNPDLVTKKIEQDYFTEGHFGTTASYEVHTKKKGKKAKVTYNVLIQPAYTYRNISLDLDSSQQKIRKYYETYLEENTLLHEGDNFRTETIEEEKRNLWEYFQNEGFYYIRKSQIAILADSTVGERQIDLRYTIKYTDDYENMERLFIDRTVVAIDTTLDQIPEEGFKFSNSYSKVNAKFLKKVVALEDDSLYSINKTQNTIRNFNSLGIFDAVNMNYSIHEEDSTRATALINLDLKNTFSISSNTDINYKTTGFIGPALGIRAKQLNIFGGAQNLTMEVNGYYDFPLGIYSRQITDSYGYNLVANLDAPLINPFIFKKLPKYHESLPRQYVRMVYEVNHRLDFFRIGSWKTTYGWSWADSKKTRHQLNFLNIEFTRVTNSTERFDSLLTTSDQIRLSFQEQAIIGPDYTFKFDNRSVQEKRVGIYYEANIGMAGNLLYGINALTGNTSTEEREILNVKYSQFVRLLSDFRTYLRVGKMDNKLVFRNVLGIGRPYGNSNNLPFSKQFFVGGTNSLRPLNARTAGPGRYFEEDKNAINQVGDLKMEVNLELRIRLAGNLFGAVWSDFGNIWLYEDDPDRPNSNIRWNHILEDSYLTSGIGTYYDLDFFVIRVDYGFILHTPYYADGNKWVWQNNSLQQGALISIGYPF